MILIATGAVFLAIALLAIGGRAVHVQRVGAAVNTGPTTPQEQPATVTERLGRAMKYSGARFKPGQIYGVFFGGSLFLTVLAYQAVHSLMVAVVIGGLALLYPYMLLGQWEHKRRETLAHEFKEALNSIAYSLRAGASLQRALERSLLDVRRVFANGRAPIVTELEELIGQLQMGVPVETVLSEWEQRLQLEEVSDFVAATLAVKTRGGNLAEVMTVISDSIAWKIEANAQIRAITAQKRSEANLLTALPLIVLGILWWWSPSYVAPLFQPGLGQTLLLIGVLLNAGAFLAVRKVLESPV